MDMDNIPQAIFDFFERMPRQGPGDPSLTRSLLRRFRPLLPTTPIAADMGCGNGAAALILAEDGCEVTGVDIHQPFLDDMTRQADAKGLRVKTHQSSMTETGFSDDSLNLIWSEGAVFTVGLENALKAFFPMLKKGGLVALSDCFFFQADTLKIVIKQWKEWDCNLKTVAEGLAIAEQVGFRFLHAECLTPKMWEDSFYRPMEQVIAEIKTDPSSPPDLVDMAERQGFEAEFFRQYNRYYGYAFLVLQKPE